MSVLNWHSEPKVILRSLENISKLKICCKTKNESELLESWIEHHAKIVGYDNLIIADNDSSDEKTLRIYNKYNDRVTIFRFQGPHNEIHWHPRFNELFEVIRNSSKFFSFVDVDERLILIDNDSWFSNHALLSILEDDQAIYPTTWLINLTDSLTRFCLLDTEKRPILLNNLKWGKPIFPAFLTGISSGIHNAQYIGRKFAAPASGTLFLLHYTQFPLQRIAVNINKLASRGIIHSGTDPTDITNIDLSGVSDKTVLRFQNEIKEMLEIINSKKLGMRDDSKFVELAQDGSVKIGDEATRQEFKVYQDNVQRFIKEVFA